MRVGWPAIIAALALAGSLAGCQHSSKDRDLRQPVVEDYVLPDQDDKKFAEGPTYPDQKRQLTQPKSSAPSMPTMSGPRGGGGGGGGGGGMGAPGGAGGGY